MGIPDDFQSRRRPEKRSSSSGEVRRRRGRPPGQSQHRDDEWPLGLYRRGTRNDNGPFFFERRHRGIDYHFGLGLKLSKAVRDAEHANYCLQEDKPIERLVSRKGRSHAEFLDMAVQHIGTVKAVSTRRKKRYVLELWIDFHSERFSRAKALHQINGEMAQEFVDWRSKQRVSRNGTNNPHAIRDLIHPKTVRTEIQMLRPLFGLAVDRKWIAENPFAKVRLPQIRDRGQSKGKYITDDVLEVILKAARRFDALPEPPGRPSGFRGVMEDAIVLFVNTGLRKEELIMLPWSRVRLSSEEIDIEALTTVAEVAFPIVHSQIERLDRLAERRRSERTLFPDERVALAIMGKRAMAQAAQQLLAVAPSARTPGTPCLRIAFKYRWRPKGMESPIPLNETAVSVLRRRQRANHEKRPFVFSHPDGGPLRSDLWQRFKAVLALAGVQEPYRVHDLRHTFGRRLREQRVPLETIKRLMRHEHDDDTRIYAPYLHEEGRKWVRTLDSPRRQRRD